MLVSILVVFAAIGFLTVLGSVIRVLGVSRVNVDFHKQAPLLRWFRRDLEENENPPKQLKGRREV